MSITAQMGARKSTSWDGVSGLVPGNYREAMAYEEPNGDFPITATIATGAAKEITDNATFNWFEKDTPEMAGAVTGVYVDSALGTAYTYATYGATSGAVGGTVYVKVAEAVANEFRAGQCVTLADLSYSAIDVPGIVTSVLKNGASSFIAVKLDKADPGDATYSIATVDWIAIHSLAQPEMATPPNSISYDPTTYTSYAGIFEESIAISQTAMKTRLRGGEGYPQMLKEARTRLGMILEKAIIRSHPRVTTGDNGFPLYQPMGINYYLSTYCSDNVIDFSTCTTVNGVNFSGKTWKEAGTDFLLTVQEQFGRYGSMEKMAICGSGAQVALAKLAASESMFTVNPGEKIAWGVDVTRFAGGSQEWLLKRSPLFSQTALDRNTILLFEPKNIVTRYITDIMFKKDDRFGKGGAGSVDGKLESYYGQLGWEFHFPKQWAIIRNVGVDNIN